MQNSRDEHAFADFLKSDFKCDVATLRNVHKPGTELCRSCKHAIPTLSKSRLQTIAGEALVRVGLKEALA